MSDSHDSTTTNTISVPVPVMAKDSHLVLATKFLSWLCASLLAVSVLVSLVSITNDRNNLRDQIRDQTFELACRSEAAAAVNQARSEKEIYDDAQRLAQSDLIVAVSDGDDAEVEDIVNRIEDINEDVRLAGTRVNAAVAAQQDSLDTCRNTG